MVNSVLSPLVLLATFLQGPAPAQPSGPVSMVRPGIEVFTVTAWGDVPTAAQVLRDFPTVNEGASNLRALQQRLGKWRGEP